MSLRPPSSSLVQPSSSSASPFLAATTSSSTPPCTLSLSVCIIKNGASDSDPTYVVAPVLQSRSGRQDLKKLFEFINEPDGEENLPSELASAVPQTITVTPEENEAIQRLQDMGFDRDLVLEVFFACNKNEDLAANYLLDHQNEFED
ncbi:hypothetical protein HN51_055876 [Arachis hypogaea]